MNSRVLVLLAASFVFALIASASSINTITVGPGSTVVAGGNTVYGGYILPFASPSASGSLEEWVVSDTTNPFGSGALDFIFQLTVSSGSLQTFDTTSCCLFPSGGPILFDGGITTGYGSPGTETPTSFSTTLVEGLDDTWGPVFTFGSGITTGTSVDLILQTSTGYLHSAFVQINGVTQDYTVYGPLPEPRSAVFLLGCIFAVGLLVNRRLHAKIQE